MQSQTSPDAMAAKASGFMMAKRISYTNNKKTPRISASKHKMGSPPRMLLAEINNTK